MSAAQEGPFARRAATAEGPGVPAIAAVLALYLALCFLCFDQIEEDAFIYFRFAENLADGHGYVFNRGGEVVESGSSLPWLLILTAASGLPGERLVQAKLIGMAFGAFALLLTWRLATAVLREPRHAFLPPLLLTVSIPFYTWSQRGLESAFHLCCLLGAALVACTPRWRGWWWIAGFVVFVSRPEGPLTVLALFPFVFWDWRSGRPVAAGASAFLLACALLVTFRLVYFHDPIPHPFYLKMGDGSERALPALLSYARSNHLLWLFLPAGIGVLRRSFWCRPSAVVLAFTLVTLAWAVIGEDWKPYNRHLLPALPFAFILAVHGLAQWVDERFPRWVLQGAVGIFAALILTTSQGVANFVRPLPNPAMTGLADLALLRGIFAERILGILRNGEGPPPRGVIPPVRGEQIAFNYQATTGKFLRENYPAGITYVYDQMGQTPWYAGIDKTAIDSLGLVDRTVGIACFADRSRRSPLLHEIGRALAAIAGRLWPDEHRPSTFEEALERLFSAEADLILVNKIMVDSSPQSMPARIVKDPRLRENYRPAFLVNGLVQIYERKGLASPAKVRLPVLATYERLRSREKPVRG